MYLEFILLTLDYFNTLKRRYFLYEWVAPIVLALVFFILTYRNFNPQLVNIITSFNNNSVSFLGVLIGFSITIITILTTSSSSNIDKIKAVETDHKISGKKISLFQLLLINFSYAIVIEIFCLIFSLIYPFFISLPFGELSSPKVFLLILALSLNVHFILHVLLLNIRNITDFYFILMKK